jgi:lysophospholipase L1-like esterase
LFVGDSFTEGFGVDGNETFPARACEELQRQGMRIECLNAGVTGFGTAHEARLLQMLLDRDGARVAAVVFQVLPNNDLRDNWEDGGFGIDEGRLVTWDPPHIPLPVRLRVGLLENRVAHASATIKLIANAMIGGVGIDPHYDDSAFELERRLLHEVVRVTESHHVPIVIAVCATAWELGGTRSGPYDDHARLDFVTATVEKLHVPWLDSRDVVGTSEYYIPNDGHFSAEGNAMIGRALAKLLLPLVSRGTEPSA